MRLLTVVLLGLVGSGCADGGSESSDEGRVETEPDGFSYAPPIDWQVHRDRGAVLFTSKDDRRRTIAVRSLPLPRGTTASDVVSDTQLVLQNLPGVELQRGREIRAAMPGTEYRLTFAPPTSSERYQRRHVVLRGKRHVFHVIETSPITSRTDDALLELVSSMREEG